MRFIITKDEKETIATLASDNQTLIFLVSYKRRENQDICTILLQGSDLNAKRDYKWIEEKVESDCLLNLGLSFSDSKDLKESVPISIEEDKEAVLKEIKLRSYHKLRKELEEEGLI